MRALAAQNDALTAKLTRQAAETQLVGEQNETTLAENATAAAVEQTRLERNVRLLEEQHVALRDELREFFVKSLTE